jgi:hypothetical protein
MIKVVQPDFNAMNDETTYTNDHGGRGDEKATVFVLIPVFNRCDRYTAVSDSPEDRPLGRYIGSGCGGRRIDRWHGYDAAGRFSGSSRYSGRWGAVVDRVHGQGGVPSYTVV